MTLRPVCAACSGEGWVDTAGGIDVCPLCRWRAEVDWAVYQQEWRVMWNEHTNKRGRGSDPSAVVMECKGDRLTLTVGRGVLEQIPWFRGGAQVVALVGRGAEAGKMRIERGNTHKLLSLVSRPSLEKLPPVVLRMDALETMAPGAEHAPEPVAHRVMPGILEIVLPSWAAPPVPATAPPTSFQHAFFLPHEDRRAAGGAT